MKGRKSSWKSWLSRRAVITAWLSGILIVVYGVAFLTFLFVSWFLPGSTTLTTLMERCLAILTPLVAVVVEYYLRHRKQDSEDEEG
ncbi:MAG: hypothetical protein H6669_07255 [Ardenticatenaceae bacterium]|nr:hypothetical protein [Ardenticatenaceae bacterium]